MVDIIMNTAAKIIFGLSVILFLVSMIGVFKINL